MKHITTIKVGVLALAFCEAVSAFSTTWPTVTLPTISSTVEYNITNYGATTTSKDNTAAIQAALDACVKGGGGKVVVPADTFLCGPIVMGSNTNLYLSKGAVLEILPYGQGNGIDENSYPNNGTTNSYANFITCNGTKSSPATNLKISGQGTIYGNGSAWWTAYDSLSDNGVSMKRGCLIRWFNAKYMEIDSVTFKDAPGSHITIGQNGSVTSDATIHNVTINTQVPSHNTDGIDTWAPNIDILNCYISDGDDNVAIDRGSQYIRIMNCDFGYGHGTSVGSYTSNVAHVLVDNCTYTGTDNGIRLKSNRDRGGNENDFTFSNLTMNNVKYAVYIDCYYDSRPKTPALAVSGMLSDTATTPGFRDILIKNVTATGVTVNSINIYGRPEHHVKNITFDNVNISAAKGMLIDFADSVRFINGCNVTNTTSNGLLMQETYATSFVDSLAAFSMPISTSNVSDAGTNAESGYSWAYSNMKYVSGSSSQDSKNYYEFTTSSSVVLTAPDGTFFKNGDFLCIDAYTTKSNNAIKLYTDNTLNTCIGAASLTQSKAQNYYLFLTGVPDSLKQIYVSGTSSINAYVFVHALTLYGVRTSANTGIENIQNTTSGQKKVKEVRYYDLNGRQISSAFGGQFVVKQFLYDDGTSKGEKVYLR